MGSIIIITKDYIYSCCVIEIVVWSFRTKWSCILRFIPFINLVESTILRELIFLMIIKTLPEMLSSVNRVIRILIIEVVNIRIDIRKSLIINSRFMFLFVSRVCSNYFPTSNLKSLVILLVKCFVCRTPKRHRRFLFVL